MNLALQEHHNLFWCKAMCNPLLTNWHWYLFYHFVGIDHEFPCSALWGNQYSWSTIWWPRSDCRGQGRLYALHRRSKFFHSGRLHQCCLLNEDPRCQVWASQLEGIHWPRLCLITFFLRLEHQAPLPNLAPVWLYRVTFEKHHCWGGWEAGWTRDRGCYFDGWLYTVGSCPEATPQDP